MLMNEAAFHQNLLCLVADLEASSADQAEVKAQDAIDYLTRLLNPPSDPSKTGSRSQRLPSFATAREFGIPKAQEILKSLNRVFQCLADTDVSGALAASRIALEKYEREPHE